MFGGSGDIMDDISSHIANAPGEDTLSGYVLGFTVGTFVQMLELEEKTCTLNVQSKGREGVIYFKKGIMLNAETGDLKGEVAAYTILGWADTQLKLENGCPINKRVIRS